MGPTVNGARSSVKQKQGMEVDRRYLAIGDVFDDEVTTVVFLTSTRTQGYPRLGRWLTGASTPASMADGGGRTVARRPSPTMAGTDEDSPTSTVT